MVRPPIHYIGCGQAIAFQLTTKILRNHFYLELVLARPNNQNRGVGVRFMDQRYFLISVEPVVAAGWLVSTAAGAAAGGVARGLLGALTQAEASSEDAYVYVEGFRRGGTLARAFRTPIDRAAKRF